MPVITISRQFGAGGHTLGETLASHLGYQLVDRNIIYQIAKEANVSAGWVEAVEREAGGLLMRMVNRLVSGNFIERLVGDAGTDFTEEKYVEFVRKVLNEIHETGNAVIVGRGAQFILPDGERTIKILLVADLESRINFMMENYDLTWDKAEQVVRREEKRRQSFLSVFDNRNPDDPALYSLCFNTTEVRLEDAEEVIVELVKDLADEYSKPIW